MKTQDIKSEPRAGFKYYRRTKKDVESGQRMRHWCGRQFFTRDDVFILPIYLATNALKWEFLEEYVFEEKQPEKKEPAKTERKPEKKETKKVEKKTNKKKAK